MSGPITCGYVITEAILAMYREWGEVRDRQGQRTHALQSAHSDRRRARVERIAAVRREVARQHARLVHMHALAETVGVPAGAVPDFPAGDDDAAWTGYLRRLEAALRDVEAALANVSAAAGDKLRATLTNSQDVPSVDDVLGAYALQRRMRAGLDPAQADRFRETAARVLARLDLAAGEPLPAELDVLAKSIVLAPSVDRAEALATELRRAVAQARKARDAALSDAGEAIALLVQLPDDAPESLVEELERVAAGVAPLDASLRKSAEEALDDAAIDSERIKETAASLVLAQSLRDLGYEVEDIEATLFVDGGTTHFRRAGWENYFVRLRVDPRTRSIDFNVVRAGAQGDGAERRREDVLAEDRWCAEFPALMRTLEARGLVLDVRRRLEAGEVPVEVVDAATLPRVAADDEGAPRAPPKARPIG
jgi:hypothetical protein